ncbi:hypothetical protein Hanom_Chr03g00230931 [Helianthus anomalus]
MVKPDLDLWTGTDPIFRIVNRFCILCLIGSRVGSGRVGFFFFCSLPVSIEFDLFSFTVKPQESKGSYPPQ